MAIVSLLITGGQKRTTFRENNSDTDILPIDCTVSRSTNFENELTQHPVEDGPDVTDHIRSKPITMQIEGIISESPLGIEGQKAGLVSSGASYANRAVGGFKGAAGSTIVGAGAGKLGAKLFQSGGSPAELGRKALENLITQKIRFRIAIGTRILDNMVMTRLSIPEDNQIGQALKFTATIQQIMVVTGETVLIEKISSSVAHTAGKKTNLGAQATTEATSQKKTSILKAGTNFLGGLFGGGN